jgi:hypothetical protein
LETRKQQKRRKMNRIFLGGTCAGTNWRDELIALLKNCNVEWFNPIVEDWTPECQANEENEKNNKCNVHLYVITPEMQGVYSIAEIVNSCWQAQLYGPKVNKVAFFTLGDFGIRMRKSLEATFRLCSQIAPFRCICGIAKNVEEIFESLKATGYVE